MALTKGQYRQIGPKGEWSGLKTAVGLNGRLYTIDSSGSLLYIDTYQESTKKIAANAGWDSKFLLTSYYRLFTIEESGSLFSLDSEDGTFAKCSDDGQWSNTMAATANKGRVYTRDGNGTIYEIDAWRKEAREVGTGTWTSRWLVDASEELVSLEESGTLYRINIKAGTFTKVGNDDEWKDSKAMAGRSGSLFICSAGGAIYNVNIWNGEYTQIGDSHGWDPAFLVMGDGYLYDFEKDGSLFEIGVY